MSGSADQCEAGGRGPRSERGVALVMVMSFLALMLLLGLAVSMASMTDLDVSTGTKLTMDAFNTAERGQAHAYELVRHMNGDFTCLLRGEDNELKTGDEFDEWGATVRAFNIYGGTTGDNLSPMFNSADVNVIPQQTTDGGARTRAIVRVDNRHFYELVVYDDANDPNAFLDDLEIETYPDPNDSPSVDCDSRVVIRSIGYVMREPVDTYAEFTLDKVLASTAIDSIIGLIAYPAVLANGDVSLGGNAHIEGPFASVHTNDDLSVSGNYYVENSVTWSNSDNVGSNPTVPPAGGHPSILGYHETVDVPDLDPLAFGKDMDVIFLDSSATPAHKGAALGGLSAYGVSYDSSANAVIINGTPFSAAGDIYVQRTVVGYGTPTYSAGAVGSGVFGFSSSGSNWSVNIPAAADRSYLVVSTVTSTTSFAGNSPLTALSVLTNGSLQFNGNVRITPTLRITAPRQPAWNRVRVLLMAGADIRMQGNVTLGASVEGLVYANEQFQGSGNVAITGQLVANNKTIANPSVANTPGSLVDATNSSLSGNFQLYFNPENMFFGAYSLVSWRELRDFDPKHAYPPAP